MYFYTPVSKTDEVSKIKSVIVANDTFYELTMPWKSKLSAVIKKNYGVMTHVMFVVTCNSNWNQLSDESTEEESAKKTLTRTISKTRTKLRDFFFLNSIFQQIYSDHLLWKQVWITVKTCYTINFIFIFSCNFPTLINFGRLRQHILSIVETSTKTFCSKNFSLVSHFAYFSDLLIPHG